MSDSKSSLLAELMKSPVKSSDARVPGLSLPEDSTAWALSEKTCYWNYYTFWFLEQNMFYTVATRNNIRASKQ
jgi:hypothetical protein